MSKNSIHGYAVLGLLASLMAGAGMVYIPSPVSRANNITVTEATEQESIPYPGEHVVVYLDDMRLELRNGTTTLESMNLISKGKPGNYYETLGGAYGSDYKKKSHFSTIGHVYLPWSVHIFGNYFIHGIPYYPDGRKVSSEYSGGCIRLSDEDAKRVHDFVSRGTPIIVTSANITEFIPTETSSTTITSMDMTRLMVATISLEVLTQDDEIIDSDGITPTTRRKILPRLVLVGDDAVSRVYAQARGSETFIDYMNQKARALGLTNTHFESFTEPVATTEEEYARFMHYIQEYKSYLLTITPPTPEASR